MLKAILKLFSVDKLKSQNIEKLRQVILESYKESRILKENIDVMWYMQCEKALETLRKYPEREALELQVDFKYPELMLITSL